jgi:colanic acid biosynthesis glycosyl transferase WcaI
LAVVIIGDGARRGELEVLARELSLGEVVTFLPYQERGELSLSLSSANVHVIGLASGLAGFVVPSRLYGVLSVARPVIAAVDVESETAQLVESVGCGVVVPPGNPSALAAAIRAARAGHRDLPAMGEAGRDYVVANADRVVAVSRYREVLRGVIR